MRSELGLALLLVLSGCSAPPPAAVSSPAPLAVVAPPAPPPRKVDFLAQARAAARRGDWRTAGGFARQALQGQLNENQEQEAQGILLEMSLQIGDYRGARELLAGLSPAIRKTLAAEQLERARHALDQKSYPDAILRARMVQDPASHEILARAYLATNQSELALKELEQVPGSGPQIKLLREEIADRSRSRSEEIARRQLSLAREQARRGQWGQAAVAARKAADLFARLGPFKAERAEAAVLEAQEAASRGEFKAAAGLMQEAVGLDPREAYRRRLSEYREKDRLLVSRDELVDVESFVFPPTRTEASERTVLYFLGSTPDDPVVGSRELAYTLKTSRFTATNGPMLVVKTEGPGRDSWSLRFTGPSRSPLKPGLYEKASSDDPDAAALDVSGCERGASHSLAKFQIYELTTGPAGELQHFAADFVVSADGHKPFFGKVRFHSRFR